MTEFLALICDDAVRAGYSEEESMRMSPRKLSAVFQRSQKMRGQQIRDDATATRVGSWAKDTDWKTFMKGSE